MRGMVRMPHDEIERRILALLRTAPMRQVDIVDAFPGELYIDVGRVVRDMDARGLVARDKCGQTKMVRLNER